MVHGSVSEHGANIEQVSEANRKDLAFMRGYSSQKYLYLFEQESTTPDAALQDVFRYRTKTIKSGDMLECEIYPIWNTNAQVITAREATNKTRKAQRELNNRNARKRFIRLVNTNFTSEDIAITLTYAGDMPDLQTAQRDMQNYIRRVRAFRRKAGMPEMKYVYVIEHKDADKKSNKRIHHHVIMSVMDRDDAERLWGKGYANARKLQPDEYGLEAIALYMTKETHTGGKRWCCSRNLKQPTVTVSDHKISRRKISALADDLGSYACGIFQNAYRNYEFLTCEMKTSSYVSGVYVYAKMHRISDRRFICRKKE